MAAPALASAAQDTQVDVVLRLRAALPAPEAMGLAAVRQALRSEADALMARLATHLKSRR